MYVWPVWLRRDGRSAVITRETIQWIHLKLYAGCAPFVIRFLFQHFSLFSIDYTFRIPICLLINLNSLRICCIWTFSAYRQSISLNRYGEVHTSAQEICISKENSLNDDRFVNHSPRHSINFWLQSVANQMKLICARRRNCFVGQTFFSVKFEI